MVERVLSPTRDLYDITTWEERTRFDRLSVGVYRLLKDTSRALVGFAAVLILVAQIVITGFAVLRSPTLGFLAILSVVPA